MKAFHIKRQQPHGSILIILLKSMCWGWLSSTISESISSPPLEYKSQGAYDKSQTCSSDSDSLQRAC